MGFHGNDHVFKHIIALDEAQSVYKQPCCLRYLNIHILTAIARLSVENNW